jgi:DNA-binding FrmR family transcriptional regulator
MTAILTTDAARVGAAGDTPDRYAGKMAANTGTTDTGTTVGADTAVGYVSDKEAIMRRLARIEGQVGGLRRMVDSEAYCVDVLTQVAAVTKALEGVSLKLLADHTNHCVRDAVAAGGSEADAKVDELLSAVERFARTR